MSGYSTSSEIPSLSSLHISDTTEDMQHEDNSAPSVMADQAANSPPPKSSMYPELHNYVAEILDEDGLEYSFRDHDKKVDIKRQYDTNIIGRFTCRSKTCRFRQWSSNSIAITIQEYEDNSYNVIMYHQICSRCRKSTRATLDKLSYSDRVAYRLKKWNGIDAKQLVREVESNGDHKERLCEGCIKGICSKKKSAAKRIF
ncbi:zinc-binding domain-containing protein [Fusarium avenaceum]|nr:zinc-binding domain-containing protein [Fusarium avenaceum]